MYEMLPPKPQTVGRGIVLTLLLHLWQIPMVSACLLLPGYGGMWALIIPGFIGVTQLVYMIPAMIIQGRKGRPEVVKGLIIGAAVTFLLNASCYGSLFVASRWR